MQLAMRILIGLFGLIATGLALAWLAAPMTIGDTTQTTFGSLAALSNARGDLGGAFTALAAFSFLGIRRTPAAATWLLALAITLAAVATGRIVSLLVDGVDPAVVPSLGIELLIAATALLLRRALRSQAH